MEQKKEDHGKWPTALWVGVGLSVVWFAVLIVYAVSPAVEAAGSGTEALSRWQKFWRSAPNEFGDALAGIFAPLAFLWLVVTVLLQSRELELQREELKSTRQELHRSAAQHEKQSEILLAQAERQEQMFLQSHFEDRYRSLLLSFYTIGVRTLDWKLGPAPGSPVPVYHFLFESGDEITETYLSKLLDEPIHSSSKWLLQKLSHGINLSESSSFQLERASNSEDVRQLLAEFRVDAAGLHDLVRQDRSGVINIKLKRARLDEITRATDRILSRL